jgi:hypothetical protein
MNEPDKPSPNLRLATNDEVSDALAHALRFNGRKRSHDSDELQARITAGHLLRSLEMSGFVLMKKPPAASYSGETMGLKPAASAYPLKD